MVDFCRMSAVGYSRWIAGEGDLYGKAAEEETGMAAGDEFVGTAAAPCGMRAIYVAP